MMKNEIKKRGNYAFIDSQNLNLGVRSQGWRLDFGRFRTYLKNKYNVVQAFLFIGHIAGNEMLYTNLQKNGYLLIFKPTLEYKENEKVKIAGMKPTMISQFFPEISKEEAEEAERNLKEIIDNSL